MKIQLWHFSSGFLLNKTILYNNCIILDVILISHNESITDKYFHWFNDLFNEDLN